jgi:hypothetical protein
MVKQLMANTNIPHPEEAASAAVSKDARDEIRRTHRQGRTSP